jgi:hypothetical protein
MPLRETITAQGPVDIERTWEVARALLDQPVPSAEETEATLPGFARAHRATPPAGPTRYRVHARAASLPIHRLQAKASARARWAGSPALRHGRSKAWGNTKSHLKRRYARM